MRRCVFFGLLHVFCICSQQQQEQHSLLYTAVGAVEIFCIYCCCCCFNMHMPFCYFPFFGILVHFSSFLFAFLLQFVELCAYILIIGLPHFLRTTFPFTHCLLLTLCTFASVACCCCVCICSITSLLWQQPTVRNSNNNKA